MEPGGRSDSRVTEHGFVLRRLGPEAWLAEIPAPLDDEADDPTDTFGEQAEWGFAIPAIFRVLASPRSGEVFPRAPEQGDPTWFSCGYWSSLLHMMLYSMGWFRPDLGLSWWYESGKPSEDPRLQLLSEVFDSDGQLDWFAEWLWTVRFNERVHFPLEEFTAWIDPGGALVIPRDGVRVKGQEASASGIYTPFGGGSDALHLTMHCTGPVENGWSEPLVLHPDPGQPMAVVISDSMVGWYRSLCLATESLMSWGSESVGVDVFVKPTGWLGTFRRSQETGLWFSGSEHVHRRGA